MGGINGAEFMVLLLVVLLVAGPERLPEFAQQLGRVTREVKRVATGARERVREEFGEEFEDLDLAAFDPRQYDPRRIVRDALLEDEPVARPRPRADRRGVTAPRPSGSHRVGAAPVTPSATPGPGPAVTSPTVQNVVASASAGPPPVVVSGPTGPSEPPAMSTATTTPGAALRPGDGAPGRPGAATPAATAPVLSPREIVARTRGVRPAYESPAVVAALASTGLTAESIHEAARANADGTAATPTAEPTPAGTTPSAPVEDGYVVPFDDEAT